MGTYRTRFTIFAITGDPLVATGAGDTAGHQYDASTPGDKTGRISYFLTGNCFFLDGSVVGIDFNGLPVGFSLTSLVSLHTPAFGGSFNIGSILLGASPHQGSGELILNYNTYSKDVLNTTALLTKFMNVQDINFVGVLDLTAFLLIDITTIRDPIGTPSIIGIFDVIDAQGNYVIISGNFNTNSGPYNNGDEVEVTATSNLNGVNEIQLTWDDGSGIFQTISITSFTFQSSIILRFLIPLFTFHFSGTVYVIGIGNGVQFSGSVILGVITVLVENGSGLYRITVNKTNDTIYQDSGISPTTADVKIPNPFGKTGFIGG